MFRFFERFEPKQAESSFIAQRVTFITGRVFSIALLLTMIEASNNAFNQMEFVQPIWFWFTWGLTVFGIAVALAEYWLLGGGTVGLKIHALAVIFALVTWQFSLSGVELPTDFRPWIWWQLGMGALSAGLAFSPALGWLLAFAQPAYWIYLRTQEFSGGPDVERGIQDAVYTVLLASVILSLVNLLKIYARRADAADLSKREAQVEQAKADAIERERMEIDSLVHEKILATIEAARLAEPGVEHESLAKSAFEALEQLKEFGASYQSSREEVSVRYVFDALANTANQFYREFTVSQSSKHEGQVDLAVANAFIGAAIQAMDNSLKHAGGTQVVRKLHLKSKGNTFKIVIEDDGRGFRPANVARDRVGVRRTIRGRVESVGGSVKIDSAPGQGCRVILEWEAA